MEIYEGKESDNHRISVGISRELKQSTHTGNGVGYTLSHTYFYEIEQYGKSFRTG